MFRFKIHCVQFCNQSSPQELLSSDIAFSLCSASRTLEHESSADLTNHPNHRFLQISSNSSGGTTWNNMEQHVPFVHWCCPMLCFVSLCVVLCACFALLIPYIQSYTYDHICIYIELYIIFLGLRYVL